MMCISIEFIVIMGIYAMEVDDWTKYTITVLGLTVLILLLVGESSIYRPIVNVDLYVGTIILVFMRSYHHKEL